MKNSSVKIQWTCPRCNGETEVTVYPVIPGVTWGPPENCYPDEGGEIEPQNCEHCNRAIELDGAHEQAESKLRAQEADWADSENDRKREDG